MTEPNGDEPVVQPDDAERAKLEAQRRRRVAKEIEAAHADMEALLAGGEQTETGS